MLMTTLAPRKASRTTDAIGGHRSQGILMDQRLARERIYYCVVVHPLTISGTRSQVGSSATVTYLCNVSYGRKWLL